MAKNTSRDKAWQIALEHVFADGRVRPRDLQDIGGISYRTACDVLKTMASDDYEFLTRQGGSGTEHVEYLSGPELPHNQQLQHDREDRS